MARFKSIQAGGGRLALMNEDMSGCPKESRSGNPRNLRYENKLDERNLSGSKDAEIRDWLPTI